MLCRNLERMLINQEKYKNLNSNFCSIDDKATYNDNLKSMPADWAWRQKEIIYTTNSNGFRTKELTDINWNNYFLSFGDSTVFGIGLSTDLTFTNLVSAQTNIEGINLGIPGCSTDLIYYNLLTFLENAQNNPRFILIVWPNLFRKLWFVPNDPYLWIPELSHSDKKLNDVDNLSVSLSLHQDQLNKEFLYRRKSIQMLCKAKGIKLIDICLPWESRSYSNLDDIKLVSVNVPEKYTIDYFNKDRARDWTKVGGGHYGPLYHEAVSDYVLSCLN